MTFFNHYAYFFALGRLDGILRVLLLSRCEQATPSIGGENWFDVCRTGRPKQGFIVDIARASYEKWGGGAGPWVYHILKARTHSS